jgi:hypothetical protein
MFYSYFCLLQVPAACTHKRQTFFARMCSHLLFSNTPYAASSSTLVSIFTSEEGQAVALRMARLVQRGGSAGYNQTGKLFVDQQSNLKELENYIKNVLPHKSSIYHFLLFSNARAISHRPACATW